MKMIPKRKTCYKVLANLFHLRFYQLQCFCPHWRRF